jgi:hypothetical protein
MWPVIRTALQRPQIVVILALLFLVTDAVLAIRSTVSAASDPDRLHPADFPGPETLLEAPHDDDDCVPPSDPSLPFPTTGIPTLQHVTLGGTTCPSQTSAPTAR